MTYAFGTNHYTMFYSGPKALDGVDCIMPDASPETLERLAAWAADYAKTWNNDWGGSGRVQQLVAHDLFVNINADPRLCAISSVVMRCTENGADMEAHLERHGYEANDVEC